MFNLAKTTRQTSKLQDGTEHISIDKLQETRSNSTLNLDNTCNNNIHNIQTTNATATIITAETSRHGDVENSNYSEFESDGSLKFNGSASVWDDLPPNPIVRSRQAAANNPTLATFKNNIQQYTFSVNDYVMDNLEILHEYKEGSDFRPHVHWATNGSEEVDKEVAWEFEYTYSNRTINPTTVSEAFLTSSVLTASTIIPANTPDRAHINTIFPTVSMPSLKIGAIFCYNIKRISSGNEPSNSPFGIQVSAHVEKDACGSKEVYTK